ncbi:glycosyltransferase family 39 protein [Candidatus Woesearchaeota archaeon]|nr:glycosyltransferase family 39 protein [Candidatus Woesearchaeota archaeon]
MSEESQKREQLMKNIKHFFSGGETQHKDELTEKRQQFLSYIRKHKQIIAYVLLAIILITGITIRTSNFHLLRDVTDGSWVSTDLDSHIYLKYAKFIQQNGYLADIDQTRFVPLGAPTANYAFPAYVIYYLYQVMHLFNPEVTIEYADIVYPIVAFAIGIFFFFLLSRRVFNTPVALLGSLFLSIMPAFLQRTMGGSSDHDAMGIMFIFMALYLFVVAWQSPTLKKTLWWGIAAGVATGLTGLTWGAWKFLVLIFGLFVLIQYVTQKVEERHIYLYGLWLVLSIIVMVGWVPLFPLKSLITSPTTAISIFMLLVLIIDVVIFKRNFLSLKEKIPSSLPPWAASMLIGLAVGILGIVVAIGPMHLASQLTEAKQLLLHPMGKDRWELTVAEQHQPFLQEVITQFGPKFLGLYSLYFLFLIGAVLAFYAMVRDNKHKIKLTVVFLVFLLLIVLTRYSRESVLDGTSTLSVTLYFGSFLLVAGSFLYYLFKTYRKDTETYQQFKEWDDAILLSLIWALFMVIAARGAIRLSFVFAPVVAFFAAYAVMEICRLAWSTKNKVTIGIVVIILALVVFSPFAAPFEGIVPNHYAISKQQATYSGPPYDRQWQAAGQWVRENVPPDAVFGHWWDYGYWVQNGFERASVLDGANKVKYWNYLMGRHVLTGQSQTEALEFLKVHNTTHYLIVEDEIGKYTAYSSIGSDENYDRFSWIETFPLNPQGTQETRDGTIFMYQGSFGLDDDFVWQGQVYPRQGAGIGAVFLPTHQSQETVNNETVINIQFGQPTVAMVLNGRRTDIPLECLYVNGKTLRFEQPGYKGCFRLLPILDENGKVENSIGAGMLISEKAIKALWVNLYLLEQNNPAFNTSAFRLVYGTEQSGLPLAIIKGRLIGPIKIWEITYPPGFTVDEETTKRYLGGNEYLPEYFFKV